MTRLLSGPTHRAAGPYELFATGRSVWNFVKSVAQRIRNRRAVMTLLEWDDHALRDIGLTRGDVRLALGVPIKEDPSARLMEWAAERRSARLGAERSNDGPTDGPQFRLVSGRIRSKRPASSR